MLIFLLYLLGWYAIGLALVFLSCVVDYFLGEPDQPVTLDLLPTMLFVAIVGPFASLVIILFLGDWAWKRILKGRNPGQITLYTPRGTKQ